MTQNIITIQDIRDAAQRIAPHAHRTPVMTCKTIDQLAGRSLFFKCENFQKVGAFKFRGACNAVLKLSDEIAQRGVVTHSSGNHAQALALAAKLRNIPAHIVMPDNAPIVKRRAVEGYGATIHTCAPTLAAREETAARVVQSTGGTFIHPYDNPDVIAGQGTAALELMEDTPDLQAIIVPIGGGGLMSGTCIAAKSIVPDISVIAAEPQGADDVARSFAAGHLIPQTDPQTIADGLLTSMSLRTWSIVRDHVKCVITVSDKQIIEAMSLVWQRMKLIIEPSAAVAVAAVLTDEFKLQTDVERIGVILSGGNVDLTSLPFG